MTRKVDLTGMSVVRARKGEATPVPDPHRLQRPPAEAPARPAPGAEAPAMVPRKARERGEPRSPVTTRLTYAVQDRLFRAATLLGQSQQALIEAAIDELLQRNGL